MSKFLQKNILISGGMGGIGRACAHLFAEEGANVIFLDIKQDDELIKQLKKAHPSQRFLFIKVDLSSHQRCEFAVKEAISEFKRIDVLVNAAGATRRADLLDTTEEEWDYVMAVNLKSIFSISKFTIPNMIENGGGAIVNISSGWGLVGGERAVSYCASKGGSVLLTKAMAIDYGKNSIRVNSVCPGDTDTEMLEEESLQLDIPYSQLKKEGQKRPLGRIGNPIEIAKSVLFLASDDASFITGTTLVVDGGGLAGTA